MSSKAMRRTLTGLALCLALGGTGLVAYPFATDLWAARLQSGLTTQLASTGTAERFRTGEIKSGDPLTRLEIPTIDVDTVVVEGTSLAALRAGAGHYPDTPLPGEAGNVAIAGHRTTYGRPFNRIDELKAGDEVVLTTPLGRYTYEVIGPPGVVEPTDYSAVIDEYPADGDYLTLTSCHPEGSAAYRIVVRAKLIESVDTLAARTS
ncbi:MAG: class E sortase [Actinomycetota bacterium]